MAEAMSTSTISTRGGADYDGFARGAMGPYYTFNLTDTSKDVQGREIVDTRGIVNALYRKVGDIMQDLDI